MPKDYAKKKSPAKKKRGASRGNNKPAVPASLWIFTGLFIAALIAGLSYLKWYHPASPKTIESGTPLLLPKKATTPKISQPEKTKETSVPFYEVHKDLTNKKVEIPKEDLKLPDSYKNYYYTMPCGSFKDRQRAEELKARIGFAGSNSAIIPSENGQTTWYRVQIGPYNSKRTAEKIRHRMQDNGIHDCVIRRHIKQ